MNAPPERLTEATRRWQRQTRPLLLGLQVANALMLIYAVWVIHCTLEMPLDPATLRLLLRLPLAVMVISAFISVLVTVVLYWFQPFTRWHNRRALSRNAAEE